MSKSPRTALILGATGGIGGETARALARRGWKIRALFRNGKSAGTPTSWEWVKGDSLDQASITVAADGADAIVHAVSRDLLKFWIQFFALRLASGHNKSAWLSMSYEDFESFTLMMQPDIALRALPSRDFLGLQG